MLSFFTHYLKIFSLFIAFTCLMYGKIFFFFSLYEPSKNLGTIDFILQVALAGEISMWTSFFLNLVPLILFGFLCFKAKSNVTVGQYLTSVTRKLTCSRLKRLASFWSSKADPRLTQDIAYISQGIYLIKRQVSLLI